MTSPINNPSASGGSAANSRITMTPEQRALLEELLAQGSSSERTNSDRRYGGSRITGVFDIGTEATNNYSNSRRYGGGLGGTANRGGSNYSTIGRLQNKYVRMFDRNNDGVVSDGEAIHYLLTTRNLGSKRSNKIFSVNANAQDFDKVINAFDVNKDAIFSREELTNALLTLRTAEYSDIRFENALKVLRQHSDLEQIKNIVEFIDNDLSGKVSELEILDTVLASRRGEIDINNEDVQKILRTNPNYDRIMQLLENATGNFDGEITDRDVYEVLMGLRSGTLTSDRALMALFLSRNANRDAIERSIEAFDVNIDGQISNEEFASTVLAIRRGEHESGAHNIVLGILDQDPNFSNLKAVIENIDKDPNGTISDEEVIDFSLAVRGGRINLDQSMTELILGNNANLQSIREMLALIDANSTGTIENAEVFNTLIALRKGEISRSGMSIINKILDTNGNADEIFEAISAIDTSGDGIVSDQELIEAKIMQRRGAFANINSEYLNLVMGSNSKSSVVDQVLNIFDADANGQLSKLDFVSKILSYRQGSINPVDQSIFDSVVASFDTELDVLEVLNIFDADNNGVISDREFARGLMSKRSGAISVTDELMDLFKSKNANSQIILDAVSILDANNNGIVNAEEFVNNFLASVSVNGQVDSHRMAVISNLIDILYPDAIKLDKFRDDLDVNNDTVISDNELINGLLNLRKGTLENPGADIVNIVIAANRNHANILGVIDSIDADKDGVISDMEMVTASLAVRRGAYTNEQLPYVQAVLMKNAKHDQIQDLMNHFDKNLDGTVSDLELMDALFQIRRGAFTGELIPEVVDALKNQNPRVAAIENLINQIDPNANGRVDNNELVRGMLKINAGLVARPSDELLINLPNGSAVDYGDKALQAEVLVKMFDQNKNGVVGDNEVAAVILANRSSNGLAAYDANITQAVLATNANAAEIRTLIEAFDDDADGVFSDQEIIRALTDVNAGRVSVSSTALLDMVLSNHPEYGTIKSIMTRVDTEADGNISNQNVVEALFKFKDANLSAEFKAEGSNRLNARSQEILDLIMANNGNTSTLTASYNNLALASSGNVMRMKNTLLEIRAGERTAAAFQNLVAPANALLNSWDNSVKSAYATEVTNLLAQVQNHLSTKDIATVGMAALTNLITQLEAIKSDLVVGKKSSFNKIEDLLDNYQTLSQSAPTQSPSLTSSIFYVDFKGNLDVIKTFLNTGVMNPYNSKFTELNNLVARFDKDRNGSFSDSEVMDGMMDYYTGKVTVSDPALLDIVFAANANYNAIKTFLDNADTSNNNIISKDEFVNLYYNLNRSASTTSQQKSFLNLLGQYSDFSSAYRTLKAFDINGDGQHSDTDILLGLLSQRKGTLGSLDQSIINSIVASNPDGQGVAKLVQIIDPDGNGEYHNVRDVLDHAIAIWQGSIAPNNLAYDFNGDGIVNSADASTLFSLHMKIDNLSSFQIVH